MHSCGANEIDLFLHTFIPPILRRRWWAAPPSNPTGLEVFLDLSIKVPCDAQGIYARKIIVDTDPFRGPWLSGVHQSRHSLIKGRGAFVNTVRAFLHVQEWAVFAAWYLSRNRPIKVSRWFDRTQCAKLRTKYTKDVRSRRMKKEKGGWHGHTRQLWKLIGTICLSLRRLRSLDRRSTDYIIVVAPLHSDIAMKSLRHIPWSRNCAMVFRIPQRLQARISRIESGTDASARSTTCCGSSCSCSSSIINCCEGRLYFCLSMAFLFALRWQKDALCLVSVWL